MQSSLKLFFPSDTKHSSNGKAILSLYLQDEQFLKKRKIEIERKPMSTNFHVLG